MSAPRHKAREIAFQILYHYDLNGKLAFDSLKQVMNDLNGHFAHFQVEEKMQPFITELVSGTLSHIKEIDAEIEKSAKNWRLERMPAVDRNLLRLGVYELTLSVETPAPVVIDEAIELGKQFGSQDTPSFLNGILDSLRKEKGL
jgi:N utilization substance protein B